MTSALLLHSFIFVYRLSENLAALAIVFIKALERNSAEICGIEGVAMTIELFVC